MLTRFQKARAELRSALLHKTSILYHLPFHFQVFLCLHLPTFLPSFLLVLHSVSVILSPPRPDSFLQGFVFLIINPFSPSLSHTHLWFLPLCSSFHFPTILAQWFRPPALSQCPFTGGQDRPGAGFHFPTLFPHQPLPVSETPIRWFLTSCPNLLTYHKLSFKN